MTTGGADATDSDLEARAFSAIFSLIDEMIWVSSIPSMGF